MTHHSGLEPLPYYKWMWRDYRANRRVQRMSWQARGLYRELLDEQWVEGSLPTEMDALADICGCARESMQAFWPEIAPHFTAREDGRMVNAKMESIRTHLDGTRVRRIDAGRDGGKQTQANAKQAQANAPSQPNGQSQSENGQNQSENGRKQLPYSRAEQSRAEQSKSAAATDETPVVARLPLKNGSDFAVTLAMCAEWEPAYPGIDVGTEMVKARVYVTENPQKRPTANGARKFAVAWLNRAASWRINATGVRGIPGTNPAGERNRRSGAAIHSAFDALRAGRSGIADGPDEGRISGAGDSTGDSADVGTGVGGVGGEVQHCGAARGAERPHSGVEVLPQPVGDPGADRGAAAAAVHGIRPTDAAADIAPNGTG